LQFPFDRLVVMPSCLLLSDHVGILKLAGQLEIMGPGWPPSMGINGQSDGQNNQQARSPGAESLPCSHEFSFRQVKSKQSVAGLRQPSSRGSRYESGSMATV